MLLAFVAIISVALVAALLRVTWEFWGPMVASPSAAEWKVYFLVLLVIGMLTPLFALVREKVHWSARQISAVLLVGVVIGLAVGTPFAGGAAPARFSPSMRACCTLSM
jgi:hypothetical protein